MKFSIASAFGLILFTSLLENWFSRQVFAAQRRIRNPRHERKYLIEINEKMSESNGLEMELGKILLEEVNHWDRILATSMNPTKAPVKSPAKVLTTKPTLTPSSTVLTIGRGINATRTAKPSSEPSSTAPTVEQTSFTSKMDSPVVATNASKAPYGTLEPSTITNSESPIVTTTPISTTPSSASTILPRTTWDILKSRPEDFSTLINVAEAVGFDESLQAPGELTLFAPNNEAFDNLTPADLLDKYLDFDKWTKDYIKRALYCLDIDGTILFSFQFQNGTTILPCLDFIDPAYLMTTPPLQISKSTMPVHADVIEGDLLAFNGVVHVIDQVLTNSFLRLDLLEAAEVFGGFNILTELIVISDLTELASSPGPFTLYAPQDLVFESYGQEFIDGLKSDPEGTRQLLLNHIVPDQIVSCCEPTDRQFETAAGFPLLIENVDPNELRSYTVNGISTVPELTELLASNAKVNTIYDILFPPGTIVPPQKPLISNLPDGSTSSAISTTILPPKTVWEVIKTHPIELKTFIRASEAIGFDVILKENVGRTVFAPNEDAFESILPLDLLEKYFRFENWTKEYIEILLFCHELTGEVVLSSDLANGTKLIPCYDLIDPYVTVTLSPPQLSKVTMPNSANIVEIDLVAENGAVYVIDQVITNSFLRYNLLEATNYTGGYSILLDLLEVANLLDLASSDGPFTIFAPSDEVFESYGADFIDSLKADPIATRTLLLNHIVSDEIVRCCLGKSSNFTSAAGYPLILDDYNPDNSADYSVNGITTVPEGTDLLTSNAKVNTIAGLLFPPVEMTNTTSLDDSLVLPRTVWEIIKARPVEFKTFIEASEAIGYDEYLSDSQALTTLFVPNEEAFSSIMPSDLLTKYLDFGVWTEEYIEQLLHCHDIDGEVINSTDLVDGREFITCLDIFDPEFSFTSLPPRIKKSTMTTPANLVAIDNEAENGVVHIIDQVLTTSFLRLNLLEAADSLGQFEILLELLVLTDILEFVEGEGPVTIFAPTDEVFESYGTDFIDALKEDIDGTRLILLNHIVPDMIVPCCGSSTTEFLNAADLSLILDNVNDSFYTINGIDSVPEFSNVLTSNGKINAITDIVLPV